MRAEGEVGTAKSGARPAGRNAYASYGRPAGWGVDARHDFRCFSFAGFRSPVRRLLRAVRAHFSLSQAQLAPWLGVSRRLVTYAEHGQRTLIAAITACKAALSRQDGMGEKGRALLAARLGAVLLCWMGCLHFRRFFYHIVVDA